MVEMIAGLWVVLRSLGEVEAQSEEPEDNSGLLSMPLTRAHCKILAQDKLLSLVADMKNVI